MLLRKREFWGQLAFFSDKMAKREKYGPVRLWKYLLWYVTMNYALQCVCKLKFILNTLGLLNTIFIVGCSVSKPKLGSWLHDSLCMMSACDNEYLILIMITTWNGGNSHLLQWYKYWASESWQSMNNYKTTLNSKTRRPTTLNFNFKRSVWYISQLYITVFRYFSDANSV